MSTVEDRVEEEDRVEVVAPAPQARTLLEADVKPKDDDDEVLDLTEEPERQKIKVRTNRAPDGELFEVRVLDDFSIADQQRVLALSRKFDKLWNQDEPLTRKERDVMLDAQQRMFDMVLDAPAEVRAEMKEQVKGRVVTVFTLAPLLAQQRDQARKAKEAEAEEAKDAEFDAENSSESITAS